MAYSILESKTKTQSKLAILIDSYKLPKIKIWSLKIPKRELLAFYFKGDFYSLDPRPYLEAGNKTILNWKSLQWTLKTIITIKLFKISLENS